MQKFNRQDVTYIKIVPNKTPNHMLSIWTVQLLSNLVILN